MLERMRKTDILEDVRRLFKAFDLRSEGFISLHSFQQVLPHSLSAKTETHCDTGLRSGPSCCPMRPSLSCCRCSDQPIAMATDECVCLHICVGSSTCLDCLTLQVTYQAFETIILLALQLDPHF